MPEDVTEDEVIFKDVLEEACEPVEDAMGMEEKRECQKLIMDLGENKIGGNEFEQQVREQLGEEAFGMMQNALSLF
jgi:hypothetical protein